MVKTTASETVSIPHPLRCDNRNSLTLTGVTDVDRFDDTAVIATTTAGTLLIHGASLHIDVLNIDAGDLKIVGRIDSLQYEESRAERGSFFSRLFR